jgi:FkbH-like protein
VTEHGLGRWSDPKLWYLGRIPFGLEAQARLASEIARAVNALVTPPAKCLALDLDNTLWGGVLGEEGLAGIQLGEDYPGNTYKAFQRELRSLRDSGVLLAVCSKNDEAEALSALERHPDGILRPGDFAAIRINWSDKAANLREIARELSISTDALAFFDDNPVEREWVRREMPEVRVIEVPDSPADYVSALRACEVFDRFDLTEEDRGRAERYRVEKSRSDSSRKAGSVEEFLRELGTVAEIGVVAAPQRPRVAQLLGKTNQFNLTTRRHTEAAVEAMQASGAVALWMRVADKFGDSGLVGAAIAVPGEAAEARIDSFLLSCRVIGREAELALLSVLLSALRRRGVRRVHGEYIATERNAVAADLYSRAGFAPRDSEGRLWEADLSDGVPAAPGHIALRLDASVTTEPERLAPSPGGGRA